MNKLTFFYSIVLILILFSCNTATKQPEIIAPPEQNTTTTISKNNSEEKPDLFYHYSIWWAFVNKIFEGDIDAKELKSKGDLALGSYNFLDGELIMLDGVLYQATEDGKVHKPDNAAKIAYANATFFDAEQSFKIDKVNGYDSLRSIINEHLTSKNYFYAFKIHGDFKKMKCGGLHKQDKPFVKGLDVLIPNRPVFERENFSGTMIGFFCPEFIGNINVAGYHLHFVSDDEQFAGHVMEFEAENLTVEIDMMNEYQFVLPKTDDYKNAGFEKEFQYKKK
ncbi:hypothetical protein AWE51_10375 [Aquimarina aggregata]|uniref:Alpha-acetolactate decarboxylase n=1 Tax=Aquimarina aggregata TaxID=1642818 RepID=A0A162F9T6_9FLAO|nr:acetolactate decarboxylase [Aquimarina aggregata]KZS40036.1 hypothetical protein AWE51_10375 [Aquimarina aggregata]